MSEEEPAQVSRTVIIAVVIVVGLAFAGALAMVLPSGDQGQSMDQGQDVVVPSDPPESTGVPVIKVTSEASLVPGEPEPLLDCLFSFEDIPNERTTVIHVVVSGKGTVPVPLLHPGEQAVGNTALALSGPPTQVRVVQDLSSPSGRYSCTLEGIMTSNGPAELEGETQARVSTGD